MSAESVDTSIDSIDREFVRQLILGQFSFLDNRADKFISEGIFQSKNFGEIEIGDNLWTAGPIENRSWLWSLHAFEPLDPLIASEESELVDALIRSWRVQFENASLSEDFPWHDHATALRLDRLSRITLKLPGCEYPDLAARHANVLLRDDFYSRHTNHGFDQALALIRASLVFADHPGSASWRKTGTARLKDEIAFAFTDEGIHVENSPAYHVGMISNLVRAREILHAIRESGENYDALCNGALSFAAWISRPDRWLAYLGDSASYRANIPAQLSNLPNYPMVRWVVTGGRDGVPPQDNSIVFEEAGYAIYRSRWDPWQRHTHLVMKSGFLSKYHRQDDDLNLLLHARGEDWLIDSGMYNHNPKDPARKYMRSAVAHNVPFLKDFETTRSPEKSKTTMRDLHAEDCELAVEASTRMYKGARVRRILRVANENRFDVQDSINVKRPAESYWLFHVPRDKTVTVENGSAAIRGRKGVLVIRPSDEALGCSVYSGLNSKFPSITSTAVNEYSDSKVIVFGPRYIDDALQMRFRLFFRA